MKNKKWFISVLLLVILLKTGFNQNTSFYITDTSLTSGGSVEIPVQVTDFNGVIGFQFTINWNPDQLELQSVDNFNLDGLDIQDFGFGDVDQGILTCAWVEANFLGLDLEEEATVFSLSFQVDCNAALNDSISFSNSPTDALLLYDDGSPFPATAVPQLFSGIYDVSSNTLSINPIITPISCTGFNDAIIEANVSGGTAPYDYDWGNGNNSSSLTNLGPGNYFLVVHDANGCEQVAPFIEILPADSIHICAVDLNYDVSCTGSGACIDVTVCEGGEGLTYQWSNGANTAEICNLPEGEYAVTISNTAGCLVESELITVADSGYIPMSVQYDVNASTCSTGGSIDFTVANGQGSYSYNWSNGSQTASLQNLMSGTYFCTVTDTQCEVIAGPIVVDTIEPDITYTTEVLMPVCEGDEASITVNAMSSAEPLSFAWNNGSQSSSLENLTPGLYLFTITDVNSCTLSGDSILIIEGAVISVDDFSVDSTSCHDAADGMISITPIGGTTPYAFSFSNGTNQNPAVVGTGTYEVTITDAAGCSGTLENIQVFAPDELELNSQEIIDFTDAANPGSILLTVIGGTAPYTYEWSNGGSTNPLGNLEAGSYNCTITDANNCVFTIEGVVVGQTINTSEPDKSHLRLFPNPANRFVTIKTATSLDRLEIFTTKGLLVKEITYISDQDQIDLRSYSSGVYLFKFFTKNGRIIIKRLVVDMNQ